jgi:hypothetical protein
MVLGSNPMPRHLMLLANALYRYATAAFDFGFNWIYLDFYGFFS